MSFLGKSLLDVQTLSHFDIESLFQLTAEIKSQGWDSVFSKRRSSHKPLVMLFFLEPSTRTVASFETAALRSGYRVEKVHAEGSSMKKGETFEDSLLTLNAMKPDLFVIRHGLEEKLSDLVPLLSVPVINAGEGTTGHPTQALLDAYTINEVRGQIEGEKVLIIGDVAHSRVAASNKRLLEKLGAEVAICGPKEWVIDSSHSFSQLEEGLKWATVVMALRVQKERHSRPSSEELDVHFLSHYQLNSETLKHFNKKGLIMHPGPFNKGVELTVDVLKDPRCHIWNQVENGVYLRGALMSQILGVL